MGTPEIKNLSVAILRQLMVGASALGYGVVNGASRNRSVERLVHDEAAGFEAGGFEEVLGETIAG